MHVKTMEWKLAQKNKTEVMVISKEPEKCSIYFNEEKINETETFTYLGTLITEDGNCIKEIKSRIAQSKSAFSNLKKILTNKKVPFRTRSRVLRCYVWPVLLYACETWTLNFESRSSLKVLKCSISGKWSAYHTQRTKPMNLF